MTRRLLALLVPLAAAALACEDPYAPKAYENVHSDTLELSALNGSPAGARAGLILASLAPVPVGSSQGSLFFDLAFDIDDAGKVLVIPVAKVGECARQASCQVGLQRAGSSYEAATEAPNRGYTYDEVFTVDPGQTLFVVAKSTICLSGYTSADLYGKLVVDSVRTADRRIFVRATVDPNCGFRQLVPGVIPSR
jgi:hypothetical protein